MRILDCGFISKRSGGLLGHLPALLLVAAAILSPQALASDASIIQEANAALAKKDYKTAFEKYSTLADQGNAGAQLNTGIFFLNGWGTAKNDEQAFMWLGKAAQNGSQPAIKLIKQYADKGNNYAQELQATQGGKPASNTNQIGPQTGMVAPHLTGTLLAGNSSYKLYEDHSKPKVLNFFWINCHPCRTELPQLHEMESDYPTVKFISIHARAEEMSSIQHFLHSIPGSPSLILIPDDIESIQDRFHYIGYPHTVILDKNNQVVANIAGYSPSYPEEVRTILEKLGK